MHYTTSTPFLLLLLFILTANGFLPGGSGYTIRHNKQHSSQNNTMIKINTAHKTTHTIKDTLHRMNTNRYYSDFEGSKYVVVFNRIYLLP
jgi:hypothetical protein